MRGKVEVYAGLIGKDCDVVLIESDVPATPEAVAEVANVSMEVARKALANPDEYIFAGWWDGDAGVLVEEVEDGEVIDVSRRGHPVYEVNGKILEPFYILVSFQEE